MYRRLFQPVRPTWRRRLTLEALEDRRLLSGLAAVLPNQPPAVPPPGADLAQSTPPPQTVAIENRPAADTPTPAGTANAAPAGPGGGSDRGIADNANNGTNAPTAPDGRANVPVNDTPAPGNNPVPPGDVNTPPDDGNIPPANDPSSGTDVSADPGGGSAVTPVDSADLTPVDPPAGEDGSSPMSGDDAPPAEGASLPSDAPEVSASHRTPRPDSLAADLGEPRANPGGLVEDRDPMAGPLQGAEPKPEDLAPLREEAHRPGTTAAEDLGAADPGDGTGWWSYAPEAGHDHRAPYGTLAVPSPADAGTAATPDQTDGADLAPQRAGERGCLEPVDLSVLEAGILQFLGRLDTLGGKAGAAPGMLGLSSWLIAAGVVATSLEVGRRQLRRKGPCGGFPGDDHGQGTWFGGLAGPAAGEEG